MLRSGRGAAPSSSSSGRAPSRCAQLAGAVGLHPRRVGVARSTRSTVARRVRARASSSAVAELGEDHGGAPPALHQLVEVDRGAEQPVQPQPLGTQPGTPRPGPRSRRVAARPRGRPAPARRRRRAGRPSRARRRAPWSACAGPRRRARPAPAAASRTIASNARPHSGASTSSTSSYDRHGRGGTVAQAEQLDRRSARVDRDHALAVPALAHRREPRERRDLAPARGDQQRHGLEHRPRRGRRVLVAGGRRSPGRGPSRRA